MALGGCLGSFLLFWAGAHFGRFFSAEPLALPISNYYFLLEFSTNAYVQIHTKKNQCGTRSYEILNNCHVL